MTADSFDAWLRAMKINGAEAAQLLGVQPNTITRYRRKGGPRMLGLACAALFWRVVPPVQNHRKPAPKPQRPSNESIDIAHIQVTAFQMHKKRMSYAAIERQLGIPINCVRMTILRGQLIVTLGSSKTT